MSVVKDDYDSLGISGLDCSKIVAKSNFALINYITKLQHSKEQKASEDRKLSALLGLKDKIVLLTARLKEDKLSTGATLKENNGQLKLFELQFWGSMRGKKLVSVQSLKPPCVLLESRTSFGGKKKRYKIGTATPKEEQRMC